MVLSSSKTEGKPLEEPQEKFCPGCEKTKSREAFPSNKRRKDGIHYYCKKCHSSRSAQRQRENYDREAGRVKNFKKNYGLSVDDYQRMLDEQDSKCAACGMEEVRVDVRTNESMLLHVDHDHKTGKVRALLCQSCNGALGLLHDDTERIRLLLAYAESYVSD